jgi:hypothetical protein
MSRVTNSPAAGAGVVDVNVDGSPGASYSALGAALPP